MDHDDRFDFEAVEFVFDALHNAFHPEGLDEAPNPNFLALWTLFLTVAGWTEDEFWDAYDDCRSCPKCKAEREEEEKKAQAIKIN
jgi:hypothetical protein